MLVLLLLLSIATVFIPMPRWLAFVISFGLLFVAAIFVLFGAFFVYWDNHMQPDKNDSLPMLLVGIAMIASQAWSLYRRAEKG
ncbi:MAG: hypothetical protein ABIR16_02780 [Dokdonella sp.]